MTKSTRMFKLVSAATLIVLMMSRRAHCSCSTSSCSTNQTCEACFNSGGLCEKTKDPLYCYNLLTSANECTFNSEPCNTKTKLSYGCYNNACYSQCVGTKLGAGEWCWLMERARGVAAPDVSCTASSECDPEQHNYKCGNSCN